MVHLELETPLNLTEINEYASMKERQLGVASKNALCDLYEMQTVVSLSPVEPKTQDTENHNLRELSFPNKVNNCEIFSEQSNFACANNHPQLDAPLPRKRDLVVELVLSEGQRHELMQQNSSRNSYTAKRLHHKIVELSETVLERVENYETLDEETETAVYDDPNRCLLLSDMIQKKSQWKRPLASLFGSGRIPILLVASCLCSPQTLTLLIRGNASIHACSSKRENALHVISRFYGLLSAQQKLDNEVRLLQNAFILLLNGLNPFAKDKNAVSAFRVSEDNDFVMFTELLTTYKLQIMRWQFHKQLVKSML